MPPLKTMHAHSCKMVEGIEIKPGRKVVRCKCNIVLGGGTVPKEKGHTKEATLTENYERRIERLYIENSERYDAGLNESQIGNRPWAVNSLGVPSTDPYTQRGGLLPPPLFVAGGNRDLKFGVWLIVASASLQMTKHP